MIYKMAKIVKKDFGLIICNASLRKKCPNTELFLVLKNTENTDQKNLRIWTLFTQCMLNWKNSPFINLLLLLTRI